MSANQQQNPQNACSFGDRPYGQGHWLRAVSGAAEISLGWVLLAQPVARSHPLMRQLRAARIEVLGQFQYRSGRSALLVRGSIDAIAGMARVQANGDLHPGLAEGVWRGALPVPDRVLANEPLGGPRFMQLIALDQNGEPRQELMVQLSRDAAINLSVVRREPLPLGVHIVMAGRGRPDAIAAIEAIHQMGRLPSPGRASMILSLESDDVAEPPSRYPAKLVVEFVDSSADQLSRFYHDVLGGLPIDHRIRGDELAPDAGCHVNGRVEIAMRRCPARDREKLEQLARRAIEFLGMDARLWWELRDSEQEDPQAA